MRDSIENISQLQKKLNDLQLENQILKNILDKAGLSYHNFILSVVASDGKQLLNRSVAPIIRPSDLVMFLMLQINYSMMLQRYPGRSI